VGGSVVILVVLVLVLVLVVRVGVHKWVGGVLEDGIAPNNNNNSKNAYQFFSLSIHRISVAEVTFRAEYRIRAESIVEIDVQHPVQLKLLSRARATHATTTARP
jgi:hypothetical protein